MKRTIIVVDWSHSATGSSVNVDFQGDAMPAKILAMVVRWVLRGRKWNVEVEA